MTAPATTQQTTIVQNAIKYATAQVGKPYIWGGTGPKGYDCSGLLYMAYRAAGYPNITRTTHTQIAQGVALDPRMPVNERPPGVLIFPDAGHVYMALGGGQIVEAATFGVPVHVRNDYTTRAYAIRQLVPVNAVATGGGDFTMTPATMVTSGLADGAVGAVTGITADSVSHIIDVTGNWTAYLGLVILGVVIGAAGLFWISERPASFLRRALPV
jgi:cell wall-associated NlpC family hydrolase